jgi:hypothetical protein
MEVRLTTHTATYIYIRYNCYMRVLCCASYCVICAVCSVLSTGVLYDSLIARDSMQ